MTDERLDHFRRKLEERRAVLTGRIAAAGTQARDAIESTAGDVEDAPVLDVIVDTALDVGALRTRELEEIEDALLRISLGEYGTCEACGRPIELDRLEVEPFARLCKEDARRADTQRPPTL